PRSAAGAPVCGVPSVISPTIVGEPRCVEIAERDHSPPSECPTRMTLLTLYDRCRNARKRLSAPPFVSMSPPELIQVDEPGAGVAHGAGGRGAESLRTGAVNTR